MFGRVDAITFVVAAAVHAALAMATLRGEKRPASPRPPSAPVVLQFAPRPAAPEPEPAPPDAAAPPPARTRAPAARRSARRSGPSAALAAATPAEAPAPAPAAAFAPVFGVTMSSTSEVPAPGAAALPAGDPGGSPSGAPHGGRTGAGPRGGAAAGASPAAGFEIGSLPSVDGDACGRAARYPRDAEENGVEGDVRLRVSLNERGAVNAVRVLSGPGHGLEEAAAEAIRHRCRFSPAVNKNGQALAFVIESYTFHFELPR